MIYRAAVFIDNEYLSACDEEAESEGTTALQAGDGSAILSNPVQDKRILFAKIPGRVIQ